MVGRGALAAGLRPRPVHGHASARRRGQHRPHRQAQPAGLLLHANRVATVSRARDRQAVDLRDRRRAGALRLICFPAVGSTLYVTHGNHVVPDMRPVLPRRRAPSDVWRTLLPKCLAHDYSSSTTKPPTGTPMPELRRALRLVASRCALLLVTVPTEGLPPASTSGGEELRNGEDTCR
jgi:hypothetical protein